MENPTSAMLIKYNNTIHGIPPEIQLDNDNNPVVIT